MDTLSDVNKAEEKMDWKPKIDIYHGLRKYIEWCLISMNINSNTTQLASKGGKEYVSY